MWHGLANLRTALAAFGLSWLVQSSLLLAIGLLVARILKRSGPAIQSGVYRTALAAVLVCPIAAAIFTSAGVGGFSWRWQSPPSEIFKPIPPIAISPPIVADSSQRAPQNIPILTSEDPLILAHSHRITP